MMEATNSIPLKEPLCHILVVDDDARLRQLLVRYLGREGWVVTPADSAADAREKLEMFTFDLIVLDVMMPEEKGTEFAVSLRGNIQTPILMLTAMNEPEDRIAGLESGADDYLAKPFEPRELVLRAESLLRRSQPVISSANGPIMFGAFAFELATGQLKSEGEIVFLTTNEQQLLAALAEQPHHPVSREALAACLSGSGGSGNVRHVDVQITRLRKKIEPNPSRPLYIQTIRGEGYCLRTDH